MTGEAPAHQGPITACAFVGDGKVASGSLEGRIVVWDCAGGTPVATLEAHSGPVMALVWDAARETLISAGHDGSIVSQSLAGERRAVLRGHEGAVLALALTADGERLVSGGHDRTIRIWRLPDGAADGVLEGHEGAVTSLAFAADGILVSGGRDDAVRAWDFPARSHAGVCWGHKRWVTRLCAAGDGSTVFSVSEDGDLRCWDAVLCRSLWRWRPPGPRPIWGMARSGDGANLMLGVGGEAIRCDLAAGRVAASEVVAPVTARAIAASGSDFLLGADESQLILLRPGREPLTMKTGAPLPLSVAALRPPDAGALRLAVGHADGSVEYLAGEERRMLAPPHERFVYVASAAGDDLFATGGFDGQVRLWRASDGAHLRSLSHPDGFVFSLSSAAGRLLVGAAGALSLWEMETGRLIWRRPTPELGFHVFGALAAGGGEVFAVGEGRLLRRFTLTADGAGVDKETEIELDFRLACAIALPPGETHALVATADGGLRRLDIARGRSELLHDTHVAWVRALEVSPDGARALTVSENGTAFVCDLGAGRLATPQVMIGKVITAAAFAPTGELVFVDGLGQTHII